MGSEPCDGPPLPCSEARVARASPIDDRKSTKARCRDACRCVRSRHEARTGRESWDTAGVAGMLCHISQLTVGGSVKCINIESGSAFTSARDLRPLGSYGLALRPLLIRLCTHYSCVGRGVRPRGGVLPGGGMQRSQSAVSVPVALSERGTHPGHSARDLRPLGSYGPVPSDLFSYDFARYRGRGP